MNIKEKTGLSDVRKVDNLQHWKISEKFIPKALSKESGLLFKLDSLKLLLILICGLWGVQYTVDKFHDLELIEKYRQKEFILAPSQITGFTPARPQNVPDSYIEDSSNYYLSLLGNINSLNIESNYLKLSQSMSQELSVRFLAQTKSWVDTVKREKISEVLKVLRKVHLFAEGGYFKIQAKVQRDRYRGQIYMGFIKEDIEMTLKLIPPKEEAQWHLQITKLIRKKSK